MNLKVPVVFITDDNFVMQTSVAITSLIKNKYENTCYDVFIVMAECSRESESVLLGMKQEGCDINIIHASLDDYRDIQQLAHISIACLLKFDICELIPQYDKLLYLDGDIIVRKDLSDLYNTELENNYAAAVKELYCMQKDDGCINAGIMLFNAKKMRDDGMRDILVTKRKSLGNRSSMDQQTYNMVIKEHMKYIGIQYNCVPGRLVGENSLEYTIDQLNTLYGTAYSSSKQVIGDASIIHFATGNKPWKYTFAICAKEWYDYYLMSPFGKVPFKRYTRLEYRLHHMREAFQERGFRGVFEVISNKFQGKKTKKVDWD